MAIAILPIIIPIAPTATDAERRLAFLKHCNAMAAANPRHARIIADFALKAVAKKTA